MTTQTRTKLNGLSPSAVYTVNGTEYTADASGKITILESWMGQTQSIVKKGNGTSTLDSDAQPLAVPARLNAPNVKAVNETIDGRNDGQIADVTTAMEYKQASATNYTVITASTTVNNLAQDAYLVRLKATSAAFAGNAANVTIATGAAQTRVLTVTTPTFTAVDYSYARPAAKAITISNSGNSAATITNVTVSPITAFEIAGSGGTSCGRQSNRHMDSTAKSRACR